MKTSQGTGKASLSKWISSFVLYNFQSRGEGSGVFSRDFIINISPQCIAFTSDLQTVKLKAPLFPFTVGAGVSNDWCIKVAFFYVRISQLFFRLKLVQSSSKIKSQQLCCRRYILPCPPLHAPLPPPPPPPPPPPHPGPGSLQILGSTFYALTSHSYYTVI